MMVYTLSLHPVTAPLSFSSVQDNLLTCTTPFWMNVLATHCNELNIYWRTAVVVGIDSHRFRVHAHMPSFPTMGNHSRNIILVFHYRQHQRHIHSLCMSWSEGYHTGNRFQMLYFLFEDNNYWHELHFYRNEISYDTVHNYCTRVLKHFEDTHYHKLHSDSIWVATK